MTAALEGGEWSAARPGRTLPPGKTHYPLYRRLGGPQGRCGRAENLVPTGIRSLDSPDNSSVAIPTELPGPPNVEYLALLRPLLLPVVNMAEREQFLSSHVRVTSNGLINANYCRYSVLSSWWWVKYHPKHFQQLIDLYKLYSVASFWIIITILHDARSIEHKILSRKCVIPVVCVKIGKGM